MVGVALMWGLRGGLTGIGEVVGARQGEGGEGGGVGNGGWGEASSLRHFSASESHGGDGGWSPNRKSSGRSPQPHSGNEGLEGAEEATLRGLDDMAKCSPQCLGQRRNGLDPRRASSPQGSRVDNKRVPYV